MYLVYFSLFPTGDNFCDILFAFLNTDPLLKTSEKGSTVKEKNVLPRETLFTKGDIFSEGRRSCTPEHFLERGLI